VRRPGVVLTAAIAWAGVVVGHLVAYALTYPDQAIRHTHLSITGHTWLGLGAASLVALVPVIVLATATRAIRTGAAGPANAFRLAAIQVPAFGLLEMLERGSVGEAAADPAVFIGLVLQVVVAVVGARILEIVGRIAVALVRRFAERRPRARSEAPPLGPPVPRLSLLFPSRRRAPPFLS
jgi:hypothetical protein